ncbi:aminotransferase [Mycolicibacterium nivoides]|uniref:Aminotransferase n=1 Tax=Mycolicibacterium nivoides TaxID=2487344 RepID=A0ABW9LKJ9_9MYCO
MTDSPSVGLFNYFMSAELPTPALGLDEVTALTRTEFGVDALLEPLGSNQDQNFLLRSANESGPLGVLKISNRAFSPSEIELQDLAALAVRESNPTVRTPVVVEGPSGPLQGWWQTSEGWLHARVISFIAGPGFTGSRYLSPPVVKRMGELAAHTSLALKDFRHPATARVLQWDLRHAERVIDNLLQLEPDRAIARAIGNARADAAAALAPLRARLPVQAGHFDITDDNILATDERHPLPDAIIDFGDVTESWAVGELAVTVSSVLHHDGASPVSVLPAVRAFHQLRPLSPDEADALWALVILRAAVLVLSGRQQVRLQADNEYAEVRLAGEWTIFERATSVPPRVMARVVRESINSHTVTERPSWPYGPVITTPCNPVLLDAGTTSPINDDGAWERSDNAHRSAIALLDQGADAVILPPGLPVLAGVSRRSPAEPATVPTAATLWLAEPTALNIADGVTVEDGVDGFRLVGHDARLRFSIPADSGHDEGFAAHTLPARKPVTVELTRADTTVPSMVTAALLPGWLAEFGNPLAALGFPDEASMKRTSSREALARREHVLADVQEHYYDDPPQIERGWREYLIDTDGRVYLDMVNNVISIGHAHPRVVEAATRQLRLFNSNSRFHYAAITEYAGRLADTLPAELDTVFLVNSGSEAVDLAIRLAMAATGRPDIVAMREAYHGWTFASDAVSTSIADNPNALETRPQWVHTVDAANSYRGRHREQDAVHYAPEAVARIDALVADGMNLAGFICESFYGNAGGVALPDDYLRQVYAAVRAHGGLTIADEVQVGYGRLGEWFWGFEQQGVVPDIIAVAKSIGAGHPLGAVVTRKQIADRYRTQGYFFSSTGGSPVSSVVGTTVLDVIQSERLQENAQVVGTHLKERLQGLAQRHSIVGTVHGSGLYLGLELVRDRETLEPATVETAAICSRLLELGILMQPTGDHQNVFKIKPPLCITKESADYFVDMLDWVLEHGW